jgi:hypothetical protein
MMASLPTHLNNDGIFQMKGTMRRARQRFGGRFMHARDKLYRAETRDMERLEHSPGGLAAIKAAGDIRFRVDNANKEYEYSDYKDKLKQLSKINRAHDALIRAQFEREFRHLKQVDVYRNALKKIIESSQWHRRYYDAMHRALDRCEMLYGHAVQHCVQQTKLQRPWLAQHYRVRDQPFLRRYARLRHRYRSERKDFLRKKAALHRRYWNAVRTMRQQVAQRQVKYRIRKRRQLEIHGGSDIGGDEPGPESLDIMHRFRQLKRSEARRLKERKLVRKQRADLKRIHSKIHHGFKVLHHVLGKHKAGKAGKAAHEAKKAAKAKIKKLKKKMKKAALKANKKANKAAKKLAKKLHKGHTSHSAKALHKDEKKAAKAKKKIKQKVKKMKEAMKKKLKKALKDAKKKAKKAAKKAKKALKKAAAKAKKAKALVELLKAGGD